MVTTDRGDVVELLDASGQAFAAYRYDAWGNPLDVGNAGRGTWAQGTVDNENHEVISPEVATKIAQRQPLRYAGYCYDSESGLYYLSARHYDPVTRQFLSKDLSRNDGEQSAYQYCLGNPVGFTDPTGYAPSKEPEGPLAWWARLRRWTYERCSGLYSKPQSFGGKWQFNGVKTFSYTQVEYAEKTAGWSYDELHYFNGYLIHALSTREAARTDNRTINEERDGNKYAEQIGADMSAVPMTLTSAELAIEFGPTINELWKKGSALDDVLNQQPRARAVSAAISAYRNKIPWTLPAASVGPLVSVLEEAKWFRPWRSNMDGQYWFPTLKTLDDQVIEGNYRESDRFIMQMTERMAENGWE